MVFALVLVYGLYNDEYYAWSAPFLVFALVLVLRFIERRILHFLVRLSWFLRLCWFMVYRTRNITVGVRLSCRADRTDRTNRIALCLDVITRCTLRMSTDCTDGTNRKALCPDVIMRCTLRMFSDRTDRTNRKALCPDVITRCTLRMCSAYGP